MKNLICSNIISLFLLFSIFSCQKEHNFECTDNGCIIFEGNVFDPNNNLTVNNALIEIESKDYTLGGSLFFDNSLVGTTNSDQNGYFRISLFGEKYKSGNNYFEVIISKDGYFPRTRTFSPIDSNNFDIPILVDGSILPKAQLDLTIETGAGVNNFDFSLFVGYLNNWFSLNNSSNVDTIYNLNVAGDQFTVVKYSYEKSGIDYNKIDSVFINSGEKGKLKIGAE